jgi:hypothetical protein
MEQVMEGSVKEQKDDITFTQFSSELLVEYIVQYLENLPQHRHYSSSLPESPTWTDKRSEMKKWLKLGETLLSCLKHDLKQYRASIVEESGSKGSLVLCDRASAIQITCKWTCDLQTLRNLYVTHFQDKKKMNLQQHGETERLCKDVDALYVQLDWLCDLASIIYNKETKHDIVNKNEVIFLFDNEH